MKKSLFVVLLVISLILLFCKEKQSVEPAIEKLKENNADLFPLEVGNIWVYQLNDLSKEYLTVIGTEVIDNKTFYKIEIKNLSNRTSRVDNYRIDSNTGFFIERELFKQI